MNICHNKEALKSWFLATLLTLHGFAQVVSLPLLVDDWLVDLSSCEVVVPGKADVQETLIVPQVQVNFSAIVKNKDFPWGHYAHLSQDEQNGAGPHSEETLKLCWASITQLTKSYAHGPTEWDIRWHIK